MASSSLTDRVGFSKKEDLSILEFILKDHRLYFSGGLNIWKRAADEGICPGRGFWSLKERFMKTICKNLQHYDLPIETRHKILNYIKASPAEKKRLRIEYGDHEDYKYVHQSPSKASATDEEKNTNNENVIIKQENVEFDESNSLENQAKLQTNSKSITSDIDPKISLPSQNNECISESQPIITNIKCNLFKDKMSVNKKKILGDQVVKENESCQTKQKSFAKGKKKTSVLSSPEKRQLRVTLNRLKNL